MFKSKLLILFVAITTAPFTFAELPLRLFASLPDISLTTLSPDGKHVAMVRRVNTERRYGKTISLYSLETKETEMLHFSENEKFIIKELTWKGNSKLLVEFHSAITRNDVPIVQAEIRVLDIKSKKFRNLIPNSVTRDMLYLPNIRSNIIDLMPHDDDHLMMSLTGFSRNGEPSVVKINITKHQGEIVQKFKKDVSNWMADNEQNVRIGVELDELEFKIIEREKGNWFFRTLWEFESFTEQSVWPLAFGDKPNLLYVKANHQGYEAIFKVDLNDKQLTRELIYSRDRYDVTESLKTDPVTQKIIGVGNNYWTEDLKRLQKTIDASLPDNKNVILNFNADKNRYLLYSYSDIESGMYIVGDRSAKSMDVIAYRYSKIAPELMSSKEKFRYNARDGLEIEGFVTLPKGSNREKLPTIIFPHGGPISFSGFGFDYWTQFFASLGFAVVEMNFRGSSGYGYDFMQRGLENWGQAMQDDVADATLWAIDKKIADPNNICIVGGSYGGYAALMGVVKTPDLYKCAVSFAGVTDLNLLIQNSEKYKYSSIAKRQIGEDKEFLTQYSPVNHISRVSAPVLLIHGDVDRVVDVEHSRKMYQALKNNEKRVEYLELAEGDHYLSREYNRLTTFRKMYSFLKRQLK